MVEAPAARCSRRWPTGGTGRRGCRSWPAPSLESGGPAWSAASGASARLTPLVRERLTACDESTLSIAYAFDGPSPFAVRSYAGHVRLIRSPIGWRRSSTGRALRRRRGRRGRGVVDVRGPLRIVHRRPRRSRWAITKHCLTTRRQTCWMSTMTTVVHQFTDADEARHPAGADPWWQESIAFHWFDAASRRRRHAPHRPRARPGRRRDRPSPRRVRPDATGSATTCGRRWRASSSEAWFGDADGQLVVRVDARPTSASRPTDCELDLVVEDLYPLTDFFPRGNASLIDEFAAHHYESSGRVTGTARVGVGDVRDRRVRPPRPQLGRAQVEQRPGRAPLGVGRDRPDLAFGSMIWLAPDGLDVAGRLRRARTAIVRLADSADVVTWLEVDGVTHRGGELVLTFGDEERRFVCRRRRRLAQRAPRRGLGRRAVRGRPTTAAPATATSRSPTTPAWASAPVHVSLRAGNANGLTTRIEQ